MPVDISTLEQQLRTAPRHGRSGAWLLVRALEEDREGGPEDGKGGAVNAAEDVESGTKEKYDPSLIKLVPPGLFPSLPAGPSDQKVLRGVRLRWLVKTCCMYLHFIGINLLGLTKKDLQQAVRENVVFCRAAVAAGEAYERAAFDRSPAKHDYNWAMRRMAPELSFIEPQALLRLHADFPTPPPQEIAGAVLPKADPDGAAPGPVAAAAGPRQHAQGGYEGAAGVQDAKPLAAASGAAPGGCEAGLPPPPVTGDCRGAQEAPTALPDGAFNGLKTPWAAAGSLPNDPAAARAAALEMRVKRESLPAVKLEPGVDKVDSGSVPLDAAAHTRLPLDPSPGAHVHAPPAGTVSRPPETAGEGNLASTAPPPPPPRLPPPHPRQSSAPDWSGTARPQEAPSATTGFSDAQHLQGPGYATRMAMEPGEEAGREAHASEAGCDGDAVAAAEVGGKGAEAPAVRNEHPALVAAQRQLACSPRSQAWAPGEGQQGDEEGPRLEQWDPDEHQAHIARFNDANYGAVRKFVQEQLLLIAPESLIRSTDRLDKQATICARYIHEQNMDKYYRHSVATLIDTNKESMLSYIREAIKFKDQD